MIESADRKRRLETSLGLIASLHWSCLLSSNEDDKWLEVGEAMYCKMSKGQMFRACKQGRGVE